MAKRVLGDDPFAQTPAPPSVKPEKPEKKQRSEAPRASTAPKKSSVAAKPRASTPPKPKRSKAPPATDDAPTDSTARVAPRPAAMPVIETPTEMGSEPPLAVADAVVEGGATAFEEAPVARTSIPPIELSEDALGVADGPPAAVLIDDVSASTERATEPSAEDLEATIRALEARLDRMLDASRGAGASEGSREGGARARSEATALEDEAADTSRELLSSEFYLRQWGRVAMRERAEPVDDFGYDPDFDARVRPVLDALYARWWRVDVDGVENVPSEGRVALVANHAGALPYDGVMLATALRREHPTSRALRWLADDYAAHLPFLGTTLSRLGAVRACQENAERLLRRGACVAMFPEGVKGVSKPWRERYKLQRFGRGGHVKLALRTRTPLVPVAIVGSEETHPMLAPSGLAGRLLGLPYVPITPTFPWLGAAGLIPLPSKWRIVFGEPMPMDVYGPDAADDDVLVGRLNEKLRATIQDMLDRALRQRTSVFRG